MSSATKTRTTALPDERGDLDSKQSDEATAIQHMGVIELLSTVRISQQLNDEQLDALYAQTLAGRELFYPDLRKLEEIVSHKRILIEALQGEGRYLLLELLGKDLLKALQGEEQENDASKE